MKKDIKTQIKTFLKKFGDKLPIPFFEKNEKNEKNLSFFQKTIEILPKLLKKKKDNEETADLFKPFVLNSETYGSNFNKKPITPGKLEVKLPKSQQEQLIELAKTGKISNPIFSDDKNTKILKLPAFENGRPAPGSIEEARMDAANASQLAAVNLARRFAKDPNSPSEVAGLKTQILGAGAGVGKVSAQGSSEETKAKLEPNATSAGGSEGPKVTVLAEKSGSPPVAALVGEKGKETINPSGSVTPTNELKSATSDSTIGKQTSTPGGESKSPTLSMAKNAASGGIPASPLKAAAGGISSMIGSMPSIKGLSVAGAFGALSKLASASSGEAGEATGNTQQGGQSNAGSALKAIAPGPLKGAAGLIGGLLGKGGGGGGVPGGLMPNAGSMAMGIGGVAAGIGGVAAGIGGVAAGVGSVVGGLASGLGKGLGSLMENSPLGMLGKSLFGGEQPSKEAVINSNSGAPMIVTNVTYSYDIYRKTADDSFMLPNFRREYG